MHLGSRVWTSITYAFKLVTLSQLENPNAEDQALGLSLSEDWDQAPLLKAVHTPPEVIDAAIEPLGRGPSFYPLGGATSGPNANFTCEYPTLAADWYNCSTPTNRSCWLANDRLGLQYNISTNYENTSKDPSYPATPPGIQRNYSLWLNDDHVNADGLWLNESKIFNGSYPGPWLQACWGDVREPSLESVYCLPLALPLYLFQTRL